MTCRYSLQACRFIDFLIFGDAAAEKNMITIIVEKNNKFMKGGSFFSPPG